MDQLILNICFSCFIAGVEVECIEWLRCGVSSVVDASAMARSRGPRWLMAAACLALLLMASVAPVADAFCPVGCLCDDETLQVTCDDVNLEVIPITLNPSVQVTFINHLN